MLEQINVNNNINKNNNISSPINKQNDFKSPHKILNPDYAEK